jgi:hypothetical protein
MPKTVKTILSLVEASKSNNRPKEKSVMTKKLTSIFPIGFEGNNTQVATEEDKKRIKAWADEFLYSNKHADKTGKAFGGAFNDK